MTFPDKWKWARITAIPKVGSPQDNDFCPIPMLPVLSKIYKRLVHNQVVEFLENHHLLEDNISGFRKSHSATSVLLSIRDDILKAMNWSECTTKLLGTHIDHHLKWEGNVKQVSASCYHTLAVLKKLRNFLPFNIHKQALVLSKLYYNCVVYHNLPCHIVKRLQRIQTACACFVVGKLVEIEDIIKLNGLRVKEHTEWQLLKSIHKAIFSRQWPCYLWLKKFTLRFLSPS